MDRFYEGILRNQKYQWFFLALMFIFVIVFTALILIYFYHTVEVKPDGLICGLKRDSMQSIFQLGVALSVGSIAFFGLRDVGVQKLQIEIDRFRDSLESNSKKAAIEDDVRKFKELALLSDGYFARSIWLPIIYSFMGLFFLLDSSLNADDEFNLLYVAVGVMLCLFPTTGILLDIYSSNRFLMRKAAKIFNFQFSAEPLPPPAAPLAGVDILPEQPASGENEAAAEAPHEPVTTKDNS